MTTPRERDGERRGISFESHLLEQIQELARLTVEAKACRYDEKAAQREAMRLEQQARTLGQRAWLQDELKRQAITVALDDGRLVTIEKQGSTSPPQHPRIIVSSLAQPESDSDEGFTPEVVA